MDDFAGVHAATPHVETEYEPTEASASYRVDPVPPSEFRQSAPVLEHEAEDPATAAVFAEEATTHDVTSISAAGKMHSDAEPELAAPAAPVHEEMLHEQATVAPALQASSIEELDDLDDLDEETLEGAADLGTMLREMSIDQITRTQPDVNEEDDEDDDDFEEDLLEEEESEDDEEEDDANGFQLDQQAARGEVAEPGDDLHDRAAGSQFSESE